VVIIKVITKSIHQGILIYILQRIDCQRILPADNVYFSESQRKISYHNFLHENLHTKNNTHCFMHIPFRFLSISFDYNSLFVPHYWNTQCLIHSQSFLIQVHGTWHALSKFSDLLFLILGQFAWPFRIYEVFN